MLKKILKIGAFTAIAALGITALIRSISEIKRETT